MFGILRVPAAALAGVLFVGLGTPPGAAAKANCEVPGRVLNLDCPAPPDTDASAQPDFDYLAWNTFIALSWPAVDPQRNNNQRGFPDLEKSFVGAQPDDLLVWETFKEKREVFNHPVTGPGPWNQATNYGVLRPANLPQDGPHPTEPDIGSQRSLLQARKQHFDSLDETVQVASEALEPTLPNGEPNPVYGRPVGPRVWLGHPSDDSALLYEVKVNYDFYQYVLENELWVRNTKPNNSIELAAKAGTIRLPYRTSAAAGPRLQTGSQDQMQAVGYRAAKALGVYRSLISTGDLEPPLIGSIHLKAAWERLDQGQDPARYHTAEAQFFVSIGGKPVARTARFGLVGLHIIQRLHTLGPDGQAAATGGTFVFATWEHVDNDTAGFTYANYYDPSNDPNDNDQPPEGFYPDVESGQQPFTVLRKFQPISQQSSRYPGTQQVNDTVHAAIRAQNPGSVWLNYRLIGTQFRAVDVDATPIEPTYAVNENDPLGIGQQQFLANLVVETNEGLQHFKGLPPSTDVILKNRSIGVASNTSDHFERGAVNITSVREPFNMGGCMGCHGVAQSRGYSFSFVLLGGYAGASTDTETNFDVPPPPPPQASAPAQTPSTGPSFAMIRSKER